MLGVEGVDAEVDIGEELLDPYAPYCISSNHRNSGLGGEGCGVEM